jgi:hypothetical protein
MAKVFFNKLAKGKAKAISGTKPFNKVMIMGEVEMGMDREKPRPLTADMIKDADKILTICCDVDIYSAFLVEPEDWQIKELGFE